VISLRNSSSVKPTASLAAILAIGKPVAFDASADEHPLFAQGKLSIHVIRGTKKAEGLPRAHIYVIHYLLLRAWRAVLRDMGIKRVIFDEIQELRHAGTEKYSAASEIASLAEDVIGLSGTPIYNYGGEIWNVLNIIEYHCLGDWDSFTREWCNGYGNDTVRDSAMLGAYLRREGLMLRRKRKMCSKTCRRSGGSSRRSTPTTPCSQS